MLRICLSIVLTLLLGCSDKTKDMGEKNLFQKLTLRDTTSSKMDVLLAMKYRLSESVIKEIPRRIEEIPRHMKGRIHLGIPDSSVNFHADVDTNYALMVRTTIEAMSREYHISPQTIASILIDREILELNENLPDAVGEEVVERLTPSGQ